MTKNTRSVTVHPTNQEYHLENNPYLCDSEEEALLEPRQIIIPEDLLEHLF